jgi:hypothetical protein
MAGCQQDAAEMVEESDSHHLAVKNRQSIPCGPIRTRTRRAHCGHRPS